MDRAPYKQHIICEAFKQFPPLELPPQRVKSADLLHSRVARTSLNLWKMLIYRELLDLVEQLGDLAVEQLVDDNNVPQMGTCLLGATSQLLAAHKLYQKGQDLEAMSAFEKGLGMMTATIERLKVTVSDCLWLSLGLQWV